MQTAGANKKKERLFLQSIRVGMYIALLFLVVLQFLLQRSFYDWALLKSFYQVCALGLFLNVIPLWVLDKFFAYQKILALSFFIDICLISYLLSTTELNQSIFLFLFLVNIILVGLIFRSRGSIAAAIMCSLGFTTATIVGPEVKSMSFIFLILLNNFAFFCVAWLSGYLADQLNLFSEKLESQSLSLAAFRKINEMIVETIPSGLLTINSFGEVLRANPGAEGIFREERLGGKNIFTLCPQLKIVFENRGRGNKSEIVFKSHEVESLLSVQILPQAYEAFSEETYLVILEDLTEVKRLEFAVRQSEKLAAIGQLASGIAHEIRNPLAGISGSIELLSQTSHTEDDKKLTKIILKEIDRLNNLISEFLDFAKPEKPPVEPTALNSLVKECVQASISQSKRPIVVEMNLCEQDQIRGHRDKLKQAFLNILINAIQAMESTPEAKLSIRSEIINDRIAFFITDTGCGMKEETRKRMFEAFHTTKPKGTGLGLAITHKILESHGAEIFIKSELGLGTEFLISFPKI